MINTGTEQISLILLLLFTLLFNQPLTAQQTTMRDPTLPAVMDISIVKSTEKTTFFLQSIIISPTRKLAVINSKFVKVGDQIDDAKIKEIHKNSVVLLKAGQKITLYLFEKPQLE